ncbi:MAG: murein hydrolase activator EnvC family protein [Candidatus Eiseniibacteriota bacterium]
MLALAGAWPARAARSATRLAGLLPLSEAMRASWPFSGAFVYPVGAERDFTRGEAPDSAGFRVLRGVIAAAGESPGHTGVDLGNGRGGGTVRAASGGLVVRGASDGSEPGYGVCVVIAHRLPGGELAYSVYAHLLEGSVSARAGQRVWAGQPLARVGRSGRATTHHLHFEIRMPDDDSDRWEHAAVVDPLDFIRARAVPDLPGTEWHEHYLDWAACAALIDSTAIGDELLERRTWWPMLARLAGIEQPPADRERLADALIARHMLPASARLEHGAPVSWALLREDVARLAVRHGLAAVGPRSPQLERDCRRHLGTGSPLRHRAAIGKDQSERPTIGQACLLLAAVCADSTAAPPAEP